MATNGGYLGRQVTRLLGRLAGRAARRAPEPVPQRPNYPGDFEGVADLTYTPHPDGHPDPGEVVWAWVPYEEDHNRGKDRPVLVVGHDGPWLLGLMLTSKDHDRDAEQEARFGRSWRDVGSGGWDPRGRPSEVRLDRVLCLSPTSVRREGSVLDRALFEQVAAEVRHAKGW